jgi:hypothetical protein
MPPEELLGLLQQRPFLPFRIHLDDGRTVEVRHPDMVLLGRQVVVLGVPEASADPHTYLERHETISLQRVVRLEPLISTEGARLRVAAIRSEVRRLRRAVPFRPFALQMENGERVVIPYPESIAFRAGSPDGTGGSKTFHVIAGEISLTGAFAAVASVDLLDPEGQKGRAVTRSDLLERVRQRPFRPFRLVLTEGPVQEVRHPDLVMVGRDWVLIGQAEDPAQGYADRVVHVGLCNIARLEPLEAPAEPPNSGQ